VQHEESGVQTVWIVELRMMGTQVDKDQQPVSIDVQGGVHAMCLLLCV
jgi:hypothetical protein